MLFFLSIICINTQDLYYCNFDTSTNTDNCFTAATTSVVASQGTINSSPNAPLSDVTAILKPTANGKVCKLPYRFGANDIYFCNVGTCETVDNGETSACTQGKFASFLQTNNNVRSVELKIAPGSISVAGQQCLIYYYHMSTGNVESIIVRKVESNGANDVIDNVTSIPMNAWTQRKVPFNAVAADYNIAFDLQRTSGFLAPYISLDEISIKQGSCDDQPFSIMTTIISTLSTSSSTSSETTKVTSTVSTLTTTTTRLLSTSSLSSTLSTSSVSSTLSTSIPTTFTTTVKNSTYEGENGTDETGGVPLYVIIIAVTVPTVVIITIGTFLWFKKKSRKVVPDNTNDSLQVEDVDTYELNAKE